MAPETRFAKNADVSIAYETFGDPATGVPLLGIMGLDFQMVWWPDAFCEALVARGFAAGRAQKIRAISEIAAPVLVISGADDPLIRPAGGRDTAARIPGARFVSYPGMGHNLPEELWPQIIDEICAVTGVARED